MKLSHILRQQFKLTKECLTNVIANSLMWESPKHINLLTEESFNYNLVRMAIPKSYEFVPEAYQQKFKNHIKIRSYWIYVEFLKQKEIYFN